MVLLRAISSEAAAERLFWNGVRLLSKLLLPFGARGRPDRGQIYDCLVQAFVGACTPSYEAQAALLALQACCSQGDGGRFALLGLGTGQGSEGSAQTLFELRAPARGTPNGVGAL